MTRTLVIKIGRWESQHDAYLICDADTKLDYTAVMEIMSLDSSGTTFRHGIIYVSRGRGLVGLRSPLFIITCIYYRRAHSACGGVLTPATIPPRAFESMTLSVPSLTGSVFGGKAKCDKSI